jgi:alpha-glucosidase
LNAEANMDPSHQPTWWQRGIIYQIYPRSFQDSDSDGIGDINGIRERLGYLSELGVSAIWISPIFPSPMADFGYDVSDYCGIEPLFGTMADFEALLREAHALGLKVILDFVPNHTSEQHPWFIESRASRASAKRDWYIWRDAGKEGAPPNNWVSQFGGPAWRLDPATGQYYLHSFLPEQPDLNWRNPAVRDTMLDVLRFWLDRGVDGFRVDVLWLLIKDEALRDNPPNPAYQPTQAAINRTLALYNADQPEIHDVIGQMRAVLDRYRDRVLIGEIYLPFERLAAYYGKDLSGAHLPFNFALIHSSWNAAAVARLINDYEAALPPGGWPNWVLGNHDQPRIAARVGPAQARIAAMLLLTLRGTPTMYYGDEIGLARVEVPPDRAQDPWERREPGLGVGRDPWRSPMQWDESTNAGFSDAKPWLPLAPDHTTNNVATLREGSILSLYRELIALRNRHPALNVGAQRIVCADDDVLIYERAEGRDAFVVALNFSTERRAPRGLTGTEMILSTHPRATTPEELRANEGVILRRA